MNDSKAFFAAWHFSDYKAPMVAKKRAAKLYAKGNRGLDVTYGTSCHSLRRTIYDPIGVKRTSACMGAEKVGRD